MKYFILQNIITGEFIREDSFYNHIVLTGNIENAQRFNIEYAARDLINHDLDSTWHVVAMTNDDLTYPELKETVDKYKWHYLVDNDYPKNNDNYLVACKNSFGKSFLTIASWSKRLNTFVSSYSDSDEHVQFAWCELPSIPEEK